MKKVVPKKSSLNHRVIMLTLVILGSIIAMGFFPRSWISTESFTDSDGADGGTPPPDLSPPPATPPATPPVLDAPANTNVAPVYNNNNTVNVNSPPISQGSQQNSITGVRRVSYYDDDDYYVRRRSVYPYYDSIYTGSIYTGGPPFNNYWWWPYSSGYGQNATPSKNVQEGRNVEKDVTSMAIAAAVGAAIALVVSAVAFAVVSSVSRGKK